jgi:hypothetical protein
MKTVFILGAGFSKNSGLPVQAEIPEKLIESSCEPFEEAVSNAILNFMTDAFGYNGFGEPPNLDDIMTCIDLSTNSGHHLGIGYSPVHLRALRRVLIYRLFSILEKSFMPDRHMEELVKRLLSSFNDIGFIVLNWDTVLENYIQSADSSVKIDYCGGGEVWREDNEAVKKQTVKVAKVHGSTNWLYCDNCRALFHDLYSDFSLREKAGFQQIDLELFTELKKSVRSFKELASRECLICGNSISSHIATFSYRKSFRANSFPNIWGEAERMLSSSERWVFIGYSLPDADYEFKHLLKIAELKFEHIRKSKLAIDVVLLNSQSTILKYKKFFGEKLGVICNDGIQEYLKYI